MSRKCKYTKTGVCNDCLTDHRAHIRFDGTRSICVRASYMKMKASGEWDKLVELSEQIEKENRERSGPKRPMYTVDANGFIRLDIEEFMRREAWKD